MKKRNAWIFWLQHSLRTHRAVYSFLLIDTISVRPYTSMPTAIAPLAVIQAVPARQAGSGGVNTQRRGPRGKIQVLQTLELVVMEQHCSALLSHGCLPPGKLLCGSAARYLTALSRYWRTHATPLCNTQSSTFQSWYHVIHTGEDEAEHLVPHPAHLMSWLIICPTTSPGVRNVEPKNKPVFVTQERKNQPTTKSLRSAEKWNFPASQLLNPHVFISFYFGLSSLPFLQDMVKFSYFSSQCLVCCHDDTAATSLSTPGCGRGERNSSPPQVSTVQSVLGSLPLSPLEVCTLELLLLMLLMSHWGERHIESTKTLLQHLFVNKLQNNVGKVYSNPQLITWSGSYT